MALAGQHLSHILDIRRPSNKPNLFVMFVCRQVVLGLLILGLVSPVSSESGTANRMLLQSDEGVCTLCQEDQYCSGEDAHDCPNHARSNPGSDDIEDCTCKNGYYGDPGGVCTLSEPGFYSHGGDKYPCGANKNSKAGSTNEDDCLCKAGFYGPPGQSEGDCKACETGTWCPGSSPDDVERYQCPANSNSPAKSQSQTDCICDEAYHGPDGGQCQSCTPDFYCTGGSDTNECPADSGSPSHSDKETDCICDGGYRGAAGGPCTLCEDDTFCSGGKYDSCPVHSESDSGSDNIKDCSCKPGHFGPNGGTCELCPENSFCTGGTSSENCPINSQTLAGSNSSLDCTCKPGWQGSPGGDDCTECGRGTWCYAGMLNECPVASTTRQSASSELRSCICRAGYIGTGYGRDGDDAGCRACTGATYKEGLVSQLTCTGCGGNTYANVIAGTSIDICNACPLKTFSAPESLVITECTCIAGYFGEDGFACTACEAGTYKKKTGDSQCIDCGVDTYSSTTAATSADQCSSCEDHSSARAGSSSSSDCSCIKGYYRS